jgi:uncharacterized protein (DUF2252 family)
MCSSLGRLRYAVLVAGGGEDNECCLMDVKEAVQTVATRGSRCPLDVPERDADWEW